MFSVIIPLYNKTDYIKKTIESVIGQTFEIFELIIINDGSTDDSLDKLSFFNDKRLKIISQPNMGVSSARNNGVSHAIFEYIAFLDADDWWEQSFLDEMKDLIHCLPEARLYGSSYYIVKNGINKMAKIGLEPGFKNYIDYFTVYSNTFWVPINCSFAVIKKTTIKEIGGFKSNLKFGEDLDLWIRIALKFPVGYLNKCLAYSNQDVKVENRALGVDKLWKKEEHVIFNLGYLKGEEDSNPELKYLLDGLRVRSLIDFYINNKYIDNVLGILKNINFRQQPFLYRFIYLCPKIAVILYFQLRKIASLVFKILFRFYHRLFITQ